MNIEGIKMNSELRELPVEERIKLVEELWDSIASDQKTLPLTEEQKAELDRRLEAYKADGNRGRLASESISEIRRKL
ncbi:addiction module protein [Acidithiobacillus sp. RW2]|jgi:putative addiction module component (TIGR02574 family)|uniref:Addiction module protein n=2 Tax=Acidithiobacillus sulfurivorans TaxID=1958756 RepID=A0ABS6A2K9_9PROT|nr:addiction module protein [Acidithiobacillus sulfurivorans]